MLDGNFSEDDNKVVYEIIERQKWTKGGSGLYIW